MTTDTTPTRAPRADVALGLAGAVGAFAGNLLHPDVPHDERGVDVIASSAIWVPAHLLIAVSLLLMTIGLVGIAERLRDGPAGGLARAAAVSAVVGGSVAVVLMAADGVAARSAARVAVVADDATAVAIAGFAERGVAFGLVVVLNVVFGGATFVLLGLAVVRDGRLPRWSGAVLAGVGAISIGVGTVQAMIGESPEAIELITILTPIAFTVWTGAMCVLLMRRARTPRPVG